MFTKIFTKQTERAPSLTQKAMKIIDQLDGEEKRKKKIEGKKKRKLGNTEIREQNTCGEEYGH